MPQLSKREEAALILAELEKRGALTGFIKCLWPAPYNVDTLEACTAFVLNCWTWNESVKEVQQIPDRKYIREYIQRWYENRTRKNAMVTEKCRRMLISWVARACELWDMGLGRCDGLLIGEDLGAAAKQMWRYYHLYTELQRRHKDWRLPQIQVHKFESDRMLKRVTLANKSTVTYANGEASAIQGDGLAFVVMEEISLYPYATACLAQAKIVTQGEAGSRGGYVNAICNAKADNDNWQSMKRVWVDLPEEKLMDGFTRKVTKAGEWFLELDWWADDKRDQKWLEQVKAEMESTPFEFREQILRQDNKSQGALWTPEIILQGKKLPQLVTLGLALDPSVSDPQMRKNPSKMPDECGIILGGVDSEGCGHVLADLSGVMSPDQWAKVACGALQKFTNNLKPLRHVLIAEKNQGGELVRLTLNSVWPNAPVELVHAAIGKRPRAEPLVALYEQGRIFHYGHLTALERQMCSWNAQNPGSLSPGRIDALVWLFTGLGLCGENAVRTHSRMRQHETEEEEEW